MTCILINVYLVYAKNLNFLTKRNVAVNFPYIFNIFCITRSMITLGPQKWNKHIFTDLTNFRYWHIFTKLNKCFLLRSTTLTLKVV
jgi:hypothetical protein